MLIDIIFNIIQKEKRAKVLREREREKEKERICLLRENEKEVNLLERDSGILLILLQ